MGKGENGGGRQAKKREIRQGNISPGRLTYPPVLFVSDHVPTRVSSQGQEDRAPSLMISPRLERPLVTM